MSGNSLVCDQHVPAVSKPQLSFPGENQSEPLSFLNESDLKERKEAEDISGWNLKVCLKRKLEHTFHLPFPTKNSP
jgi:hypothetical protein